MKRRLGDINVSFNNCHNIITVSVYKTVSVYTGENKLKMKIYYNCEIIAILKNSNNMMIMTQQ